jgi:hypothetical protein
MRIYFLRSDEKLGVRPHSLRDVVSAATMDIILPDGVEEEVNMVDDGLHGDLVSFDFR